MRRGQYRTLHKWIFIFMGALIIIWCVSGILMILPMYWFGAVTHADKPDVDYRNITISPAEAVARLEQHSGSRLDLRRIQLKQLHNRLLYKISAEGHETGYIDSQTGEYFEFTAELAERITRTAFDIDAPLTESTRLINHDTSYPFGQLPVFRVRFANAQDTRYFVTENNARVTRSTILSRLRAAIVSLHTFEPVEFFTHSQQLRNGLLLLTAILTLLGAVIGYILALPSSRKNKRSDG